MCNKLIYIWQISFFLFSCFNIYIHVLITVMKWEFSTIIRIQKEKPSVLWRLYALFGFLHTFHIVRLICKLGNTLNEIKFHFGRTLCTGPSTYCRIGISSDKPEVCIKLLLVVHPPQQKRRKRKSQVTNTPAAFSQCSGNSFLCLYRNIRLRGSYWNK